MLKAWHGRTLEELLDEHGLRGIPEEPFPNDGWSGATLTLLRRGRERFVLKRTSWAADWIARATRDHHLREGFVAANGLLRGGPVRAPYLGAAADGTALALLMPDLSEELIAWERPAFEPGVDPAVLDRVVDRVAWLHFFPWVTAPGGDAWPYCPLRERLLLLSRPSAQRFLDEGLPVGERFLAGWDAFEARAPAAARDLVDNLARKPDPLLEALGELPSVALHGDLKLANVALLGESAIGLIDWQLTTLAPVAVELGWMLVSNAPILPEQPDRILERYLESARWHAGRWGGGFGGPADRTVDTVLADWDAQVDLTWIVGLVLRGWRKGLDAQAGTTLASGASAADDLALWCERAVEAAARRL